MGFSKYKLTDEQKKALNEVAEDFILKIKGELASKDIGGILDPYVGSELDYKKLTEMVLYIGYYISACSYEST